MKQIITLCALFGMLISHQQLIAQVLVFETALYGGKAGYQEPLNNPNPGPGGGTLIFNAQYSTNCVEEYSFSWSFDRDMTVIEFPDNEILPIGINMSAKINGASCQDNRNPFIVWSGTKISTLLNGTPYEGNILSYAIDDKSKRAYARSYSGDPQIGNTGVVIDNLDLRLIHNPNNHGKYVSFKFFIDGGMPEQHGWDINYEVVYIYKISNSVPASECEAPSTSDIGVSDIGTTSASLVNYQNDQFPSIKWQYRENGSSQWEEVLSNFTKKSINGLQENTTYQVQAKVYCEDAGTYSKWSPSIEFTTEAAGNECQPPELISLFATNITSSSATLNVSSHYDAVHWAYMPVGGNKWQLEGPTSTSFVNIDSLLPDTDYYYTIQVYCDNSWTEYSSWQVFRTKEKKETCPAPSITALSVDDITTISAILKVESTYEEYRWALREDGKNWGQPVNTYNSYVKAVNLKPDTKYFFVVSVKCGGTWSTPSLPKAFRTKKEEEEPCPAPTLSQIKMVDLQADRATFKLEPAAYSSWQYRKAGSDNWISKSSEENGVETFYSLDENTRYEVRVSIKCPSGWSERSEPVSFTTPVQECLPPAINTLSVVETGNSWATVEVYTEKEKVKFELRHKNGTSISTISTNDHWVTFKNLEAGKDYEFRVRVNCHDQLSDWSGWKGFNTDQESCGPVDVNQLSVDKMGIYEVMLQVASKYPLKWRIREIGYGWEELSVKYTTKDNGAQQVYYENIIPENNYEFSVQKYCENGWSGWSTPFPFSTSYCEEIPREAIEVNHISHSEVEIMINSPFKVVVLTLVEDGQFQYLGKSTQSGITLSDLKPYTTYVLEISRFCNSECDIAYLTTVSFTTQSAQEPQYGRSKSKPSSNNEASETSFPESQTDFKVYPNPSSDYFQYTGIDKLSRLEVMDLQGQHLISMQESVENDQIEVSHLPSGNYQVIATSQEGKQYTQKLIIQH